MSEPLTLTTRRVLIRTLEAADAAAFRSMTDEPAITGAIHFLCSPFTLDDAQALIAGDTSGRDRFLGVWTRAEGNLVGAVGTHLRGADALEIGYWFASAVHGTGIAGEAVSAVCNRLNETHPGRTLFAECRRDNVASWKLLERLGFRSDGSAGCRPGRQRLVRTAFSDGGQAVEAVTAAERRTGTPPVPNRNSVIGPGG